MAFEYCAGLVLFQSNSVALATEFSYLLALPTCMHWKELNYMGQPRYKVGVGLHYQMRAAKPGLRVNVKPSERVEV